VWHILDDGEFGLVLANAAHVKNVPGRKTDVNDAPAILKVVTTKFFIRFSGPSEVPAGW
jgi:hypothetical protein